jgi:hypothetical protein
VRLGAVETALKSRWDGPHAGNDSHHTSLTNCLIPSSQSTPEGCQSNRPVALLSPAFFLRVTLFAAVITPQVELICLYLVNVP